MDQRDARAWRKVECRKHTIKLIKDVKEHRKASIISHLGRAPNVANLSPGFGGSHYEVSLLVMVYHLIWQLLHSNPTKDKAKIDLKDLRDFGMKYADWKTALKIFEKLLRETPSLEYCVISLLPESEDSTGSPKCNQFLDALLSVRDYQGLRLILDTSGGSRILQRRDYVEG